jgi:HSP20 family molecular chaperone IbpA
MILMRRGHHYTQIGSSADFDGTFDYRRIAERRRPECAAPWRPPIDVFETERGLVVRAEIGGLTIEEIDVLIDEGKLAVRGERVVPHVEGRRYFHESQVRYGPFDVQVRLPFPVNAEAARAEYVDGFLTVQLPRLSPTTIEPQEAGEQ